MSNEKDLEIALEEIAKKLTNVANSSEDMDYKTPAASCWTTGCSSE